MVYVNADVLIGGISQMWRKADKGEGVKIAKFSRTSFIDDLFSCASDSALADHCARLQIIFTYLLNIGAR